MGNAAVRWGLAVCALLAVLGGADAADEPKIQRDPEFKKRVEASIQKGVQWLLSRQRPDGHFTRWVWDYHTTALAYHTLRVCKVPQTDPKLAAAYAAVRKDYVEERDDNKKSGSHFGTEEAGRMCLAIASHGEVGGSADRTGEPSYVLGPEDKKWMAELVRFLESIQRAGGWWPYILDVHEEGDGDLGVTFTALMGLKAASRSGVPVKKETWTKSQRYFLGIQDPKGEELPAEPGVKTRRRARGWDFGHKSGELWDSMDSDTANAVTSLAICRSAILDDPRGNAMTDPRPEVAIRDGLAFLGIETYTLDGLRTESVEDLRDYNFEHAYQIERAGDLTSVERMGKLDWYGVGAEALVAKQGASGAWLQRKSRRGDEEMDHHASVEATCFALLFLARGTPPARWTVTAAPDDTDIRFESAAALADKDFEDLLDLVLSRWQRNADAVVKERLFAKATAVGPRIVPPLVRRLASARPDERSAAIALLERATGDVLGYDAAASDEDRAAAVARWEAWWTAKRATLRYDAALGRLVP